jgi:hypothetical protein
VRPQMPRPLRERCQHALPSGPEEHRNKDFMTMLTRRCWVLQ